MAGERCVLVLLHLACVCYLVLAQECEVGSLPVACFPPAVPNVISNLRPVASNTCGLDGPERVCYQEGAEGSTVSSCDVCDASVPELAHPPELMTDSHDAANPTFWQSQNSSFVQYPNSVVITFPLNKTFDINRIAITFQSARPESYAIYKSTDFGASFTPFQYYSLSCEATYGVAEGTDVELGNEAVALCTSAEAQPTPLSGGEAVFLPLQFRPSAESLSSNAQLQEWVRATHLQLRLDRLNTAGDAPDPVVVENYFYAISNVEVSGQCFCNGHAASCSGSAAGGDLACECEHNTAGPDCSECRQFYQDTPWTAATPDNPSTCVSCDCNNHSSVCRFEEDRYVASGMVSGGVCDGCQDNTEGAHCERCQLGFYLNPDLSFTSPEACIPCDCDPLGTVGGESSCLRVPSVTPTLTTSNGRCDCKANVEGARCSQCRDGFHTLDIDNPVGCLSCTCVAAGTVNSSSLCDKHSGQCPCVPTVGGRDCDRCLPGYFNYEPLGESPCLQCGCFVGGSVSTACGATSGNCECRNNIGGVVTTLPGVVGQEVVVCDSALPGFYCPGLALVYEAEGEMTAASEVTQGSPEDLFSGSGFVELSEGQSVTIVNVSVPYCGQYDLYLRHALRGGSDISVIIEIRNTAPRDLTPETSPSCPPLLGEVVEVSLSPTSLTQLPLTACLVAEDSYSVTVTSLNGPLLVDALLATPTLEAEGAGQLDVFSDNVVLSRYRDEGCVLDHLLVGGASSLEDPAFCERVTCSATFQLFNGALPCECSETGSTSDQCSSYRGQCSCREGFTGQRCDLCTPGNGGPDCQPCNCNLIGSLSTSCDRLGQCVCKPGVGGLTCNTCLTGYYDQSDQGCEECGCDMVGSEGVDCDEEGVCLCREGVRGRRCDECEVGYFNLTESGCSPCPCPSPEPGFQFATSCEEVMGGEVRCEECQEGHTGERCEQCADGYVGDPIGEITGFPLPCLLCECNGNVDPATPDPCVLTTGACIGCLGNTAGDHCEMCAPGYQGDAITAKNCTECPEDYYWLPNATCQSCGCHRNGSVGGECEDVTGRCDCVEDVRGDKCDVCRDGYHLIDEGCVACPACYSQVAVELNLTMARYSALLSELDSSMALNGMLPADILREIQDYHLILEQMLERAQNLTNQERELTEGVGMVAMDTDELEDVIGRLAENVSLAEEGLARLTAESGPTSQLLGQLQDTLQSVEVVVRVELVASLVQAHNQLLAIQDQFDRLVTLTSLANETSVAQYELALSLLSDATNASATAQLALQLLSETISLQSNTTTAIDTLVETQLSLDSRVQEAMAALREAEVSVPLSLSQARALLDRVRNITIEDYDTTELEVSLDNLRDLTGELVSETASVRAELEQAEEEVAEVSEGAATLVAESSSLNLLAVELLGRAHAALSFANRTVEEGNEFTASVEQLLVELQQRLNDSQGFVGGLEEVLQNVALAEQLVEEAEGEVGRRVEEVRLATLSEEDAVQALVEASQITAQALEVALRVNGEATDALFNATLLGSKAEELAANVSTTEERGEELVGVATNDAELITMATETAQMATSDATQLEGDIDQLLVVLEELQLELDSAELLPGNRLSEVGSMVTQLESLADSNQLTIDTLQDQVGELEASAAELRERHTSLQQHRDLLQTILSNIEQLDCRNQFQSI